LIEQAKEAVEGRDMARLFTLVGQPTPETQTWILLILVLPPDNLTTSTDFNEKDISLVYLHGFFSILPSCFDLLLAIDLITIAQVWYTSVDIFYVR
jgi:hypothetical protein